MHALHLLAPCRVPRRRRVTTSALRGDRARPRPPGAPPASRRRPISRRAPRAFRERPDGDNGNDTLGAIKAWGGEGDHQRGWWQSGVGVINHPGGRRGEGGVGRLLPLRALAANGERGAGGGGGHGGSVGPRGRRRRDAAAEAGAGGAAWRSPPARGAAVWLPRPPARAPLPRPPSGAQGASAPSRRLPCRFGMNCMYSTVHTYTLPDHSTPPLPLQ